MHIRDLTCQRSPTRPSTHRRSPPPAALTERPNFRLAALYSATAPRPSFSRPIGFKRGDDDDVLIRVRLRARVGGAGGAGLPPGAAEEGEVLRWRRAGGGHF